MQSLTQTVSRGAYPDETGLVRRAAAGDGAAFEILMRRYNQLLFRTARSILGDNTDAEDALQEAWLRAWRNLGGFRAESRLSTWLVRIVTNEALGRLRRERRQLIPLETAMTSSEHDTVAALTETSDRAPGQSLVRAEVRKAVEERIDGLPDAYRTVFMLRIVEEMSVQEVANALEIPAATVRSRLSRARALLRERLGPSMETALGEAFAFDGARCDRIVDAVLARARSENLCVPGRE